MSNRQQNEQFCYPNSRNRATTRVTMNVPTEDKRPRTPDTFEREFSTFFRKNSSNLFEPPAFDHDPFSDFSTRHHSNLYQDLQDIMPDAAPSPNAFYYQPASPRFKVNSPSYRGHHNFSPAGSHMQQPPVSPLTRTDFHQQPQSPSQRQQSHFQPHFSGNQRQQPPETQTQNQQYHSASQSQQPVRKQATSTQNSGDQSAQHFPNTTNGGGKREPESKEAQSEDDLKTHGPSYTMFKIDNPQMEISEEFPNRERIRKLSMRHQQRKQKQNEATENGSSTNGSQHVNVYSQKENQQQQSSNKSTSSIDSISEEEARVPLPDWQANVQVTEGFCKRHLSARRQGHTIHVVANKITESLQSGRKQITREWRVVAPEIVDAHSIRSDFIENENKLVITGFFDTMNEVPIN